MAYAQISNSTYMDFTGYRLTNETNVEVAYNMSNVHVTDSVQLNVAIVLDRKTDPSALLAEDWGTRQGTLTQLNQSGTLGATYGADAKNYADVVKGLQDLGLKILDSSNSDYVSSAESRTIWVELNNKDQFTKLFHTDPYTSNQSFTFWKGNLSLPQEWNVKGLWFDVENNPDATNLAGTASVTLKDGPQGIGNNSTSEPAHSAANISTLYNYPLTGLPVQTGTIGLLEPGIGSALPNDSKGTAFQSLVAQYLASIGITASPTVKVQGVNGQEYSDSASERSLDVGVVSAVNPLSQINLYGGSGNNGNADNTVFTALQSAIWDSSSSRPSVVSSSFSDDQIMSPDSPYAWAFAQLYVDGALRMVSNFNAEGDGGSGNETSNGLTNITYSNTSSYAVQVSGTSISSLATATTDSTLKTTVVDPALAGNQATLWQLIAGGLTAMPTKAADLQYFVETVWNQYFVSGKTIDPGYLSNWAGAGGVDPTQTTPDYQTAYGLTPRTADPLNQPGRGTPDVSAAAGGNINYIQPNPDMKGTNNDGGGTSAASPMWASLAVQYNTIFADQGLPTLGYMNDLLYIASAIAPGSFNDITMGSDNSSYRPGGDYKLGDQNVTPTGFGYTAGPDYDYASGFGSPNGVLLGRTLTLIGHAQTDYASNPDVIDFSSELNPTSGATQALMFQTTVADASKVALVLGSQVVGFSSAASAPYAWTSRMAEQSLQSDFDSALVTLFDQQAQGATVQATVAAGKSINVVVDATYGKLTQGTLTTDFGFVDFNAGGDGTVRAARPVAVAETVGAHDDQTAIIRLRQDGTDALSLTFFRVDDLTGKIGGLNPGDTGYAAAAQARAYQTGGGGTAIAGPGYGNFAQTTLKNVDSGDLIAMKLTNTSTGNTYWAFSQANEQVNGQSVGHLWNYGANVWGWEDRSANSDHDFNDLIVGVDFTSASGHAYLA